jgi:hypothetical protein
MPSSKDHHFTFKSAAGSITLVGSAGVNTFCEAFGNIYLRDATSVQLSTTATKAYGRHASAFRRVNSFLSKPMLAAAAGQSLVVGQNFTAIAFGTGSIVVFSGVAAQYINLLTMGGNITMASANLIGVFQTVVYSQTGNINMNQGLCSANVTYMATNGSVYLGAVDANQIGIQGGNLPVTYQYGYIGINATALNIWPVTYAAAALEASTSNGPLYAGYIRTAFLPNAGDASMSLSSKGGAVMLTASFGACVGPYQASSGINAEAVSIDGEELPPQGTVPGGIPDATGFCSVQSQSSAAQLVMFSGN